MRLLFLCVLLTACGSGPRVVVPSESLRADGAPDVRGPDVARATHDWINRERATRGLRPLRWGASLAAVAERHSQDMARRGYFDHVSPDGRTPMDRAIRANVACGDRRAPSVAENLFQTWLYRRRTHVSDADGSRTVYDWRTTEEIAREGVTGWVRSRSHRRSLLQSSARRHGVGVAITPEGRVYVTQVLC